MVSSERDADGDGGLRRVANPLRGKKDKTLWIHCVERQGIRGGAKEWRETAAEDGFTGAGKQAATTEEMEMVKVAGNNKVSGQDERLEVQSEWSGGNESTQATQQREKIRIKGATKIENSGVKNERRVKRGLENYWVRFKRVILKA